MVDRLANTEENNRRMKHVEDCFGTSGQSLVSVGRVLVGEGVLTKLCRKKPKPRQFFLFNDILVYGTILISKKKYANQHIIPLQEVKIITLEDDGNFKNGWQIISPSKSFAVYAATPTEKAEWMAHINKCINDLLKKTGKKPSGEEAAVWVPDQSANVCMLCQKTKFTTIVRKHHCRRCGSVVCGNCSSKRFLIPHISSKPVRVCDQCYDKMSSGAVKPDEPFNKSTEGKIRADSKNSLSRNEAEKLAESGSSAEESDGEEENGDMQQPTSFYEEGEESKEPARPNDPPAAT
ncbi:pleckstrin homology domain-containing family F member 2-like [Clytia hemisphaerica]|uniref:Pleckstrin homology domain-containing family F member 2 n=1 Tax=Clytia hemisphaerica TaxID=252671 RepID=A0A7M5WHY3_9CNID|eukprot:TCONS_00070673-protein